MIKVFKDEEPTDKISEKVDDIVSGSSAKRPSSSKRPFSETMSPF